MPKIPRWLLIGFVVFSFLGFLDATFLALEHYNRGILPCYIFQGCDKVTASSYSEIAGLPVAIFGAVYYLFIFITSIFYIDTKHKTALKILTYLPVVGFFTSLWFTSLQLFVIKAICFYCVLSAISSTAIFVLSVCVYFVSKRQTPTT